MPTLSPRRKSALAYVLEDAQRATRKRGQWATIFDDPPDRLHPGGRFTTVFHDDSIPPRGGIILATIRPDRTKADTPRPTTRPTNTVAQTISPTPANHDPATCSFCKEVARTCAHDERPYCVGEAPCPTCKAPIGRRCRRPSGHQAPEPHAARYDAAQQAHVESADPIVIETDLETILEAESDADADAQEQEQKQAPTPDTEIDHKSLSWLTQCPPSDVNFKSELERANLPTVREALARCLGAPGHKTREKTLAAHIKKLESQHASDTPAPTSQPPGTIGHPAGARTLPEEMTGRQARPEPEPEPGAGVTLSELEPGDWFFWLPDGPPFRVTFKRADEIRTEEFVSPEVDRSPLRTHHTGQQVYTVVYRTRQPDDFPTHELGPLTEIGELPEGSRFALFNDPCSAVYRVTYRGEFESIAQAESTGKSRPFMRKDTAYPVIEPTPKSKEESTPYAWIVIYTDHAGHEHRTATVAATAETARKKVARSTKVSRVLSVADPMTRDEYHRVFGSRTTKAR